MCVAHRTQLNAPQQQALNAAVERVFDQKSARVVRVRAFSCVSCAQLSRSTVATWTIRSTRTTRGSRRYVSVLRYVSCGSWAQVCVHFHDETGDVLGQFPLYPQFRGAGVCACVSV